VAFQVLVCVGFFFFLSADGAGFSLAVFLWFSTASAFSGSL